MAKLSSSLGPSGTSVGAGAGSGAGSGAGAGSSNITSAARLGPGGLRPGGPTLEEQRIAIRARSGVDTDIITRRLPAGDFVAYRENEPGRQGYGESLLVARKNLLLTESETPPATPGTPGE